MLPMSARLFADQRWPARRPSSPPRLQVGVSDNWRVEAVGKAGIAMLTLCCLADRAGELCSAFQKALEMVARQRLCQVRQAGGKCSHAGMGCCADCWSGRLVAVPAALPPTGALPRKLGALCLPLLRPPPLCPQLVAHIYSPEETGPSTKRYSTLHACWLALGAAPSL